MALSIVTDDRCKTFIERRMGGVILGPYACIGLLDGGAVISAFVFNGFTGHDAHATAAGGRFPRRFLVEVGRMAFDYLDLLRLTFVTENADVIGYVERLGGKVEGLLRNHFGEGRDGVVLGVLASEWKYKAHHVESVPTEQ